MALDYICSFLLSDVSENLKFDIIKNIVSKRNSLLTESLEEGGSVMETLVKRTLELTLEEDEENARDSFNKSVKALRLTNDYLNRKTARESISKRASKEAKPFGLPKYNMDRIKDSIKASKRALKKMGGAKEASKEAAKVMKKGSFSKDISLEQSDALLGALRKAAKDTMRRAAMKKHVNEEEVVIKKEEKPKDDLSFGAWAKKSVEGIDKLHKENKENK